MTDWRCGLTPREIKICEKVAAGLMSKEIAGDLGISHRTVDDHREHAMKKLGVRNAVELARKVLGADP